MEGHNASTPTPPGNNAQRLLEPESSGRGRAADRSGTPLRSRSHGRAQRNRFSLPRPPPGLGHVPPDASVEATSLPQYVQKELKRKTNDYKRALDEYVIAEKRLDHAEEEFATFNKPDMDYPSSTRGFKSPASFTQLDDGWSMTADL